MEIDNANPAHEEESLDWTGTYTVRQLQNVVLRTLSVVASGELESINRKENLLSGVRNRWLLMVIPVLRTSYT